VNRASAAHCPQSSVMTGYSATRTTYSTELVRRSYDRIVGDARHRCAESTMTQFDLEAGCGDVSTQRRCPLRAPDSA
jgi:hypothetical protein